jgi:hypothetical protein
MDRFLRLLLLLVFPLVGCRKTAPAPGDTAQTRVLPPAGPKINACSLANHEEVAAIQNATITGSQESAGPFQDFVTSQCFYTSAEPNRSVALMVIQRDPAHDSRRCIAEYWHQTFARFSGSSKEGGNSRKEEIEREQEAKGRGGTSEGEEGEEKLRAIKVDGVGQEAFWTGPVRVGGVLYVRQGEKILRMSFGGPDTDEQKLEKSKALARKAIGRLPK